MTGPVARDRSERLQLDDFSGLEVFSLRELAPPHKRALSR
jgi:hypothetical protein